MGVYMVVYKLILILEIMKNSKIIVRVSSK